MYLALIQAIQYAIYTDNRSNIAIKFKNHILNDIYIPYVFLRTFPILKRLKDRAIISTVRKELSVIINLTCKLFRSATKSLVSRKHEIL